MHVNGKKSKEKKIVFNVREKFKFKYLLFIGLARQH